MSGGVDFVIFGFPVRVMTSFLFGALLLGWGLGDAVAIAMWIVLVFVAVLVHELGHAFAYRAFGVEPSIVIHAFGGLTIGRSLSLGRDLIVSLAGPLVGLCLGVPLLGLYRSGVVVGGLGELAVAMAVFVTLGWSLFNLLPVLPLDGGHALAVVLSIAAKRDATRAVHYLSVVLTASGCVVAFVAGWLFLAVLCGVFLIGNLQALFQGPRWEVTMPTGRRSTSPPPVPPGSPSPRSATGDPTRSPERSPVSSSPETLRPTRRRGRTVDDEWDAAVRALVRHEPELALIAIERVRSYGLDGPDEANLAELEAWAWLQRGELDRAKAVAPPTEEARRWLELGALAVRGDRWVAREVAAALRTPRAIDELGARLVISELSLYGLSADLVATILADAGQQARPIAESVIRVLETAGRGSEAAELSRLLRDQQL
jgi:Zn-dependent protease